MENNEVVVVKKSNPVWKIIGIIMAIAGLCFIAVKVYNKFFRKPKPALEEAEEEIPAVEGEEEAAPEVETFEVEADAVIANAEDMVAEEN